MDRPKSMRWMLPLVLGYSLFSAVLLLPAFAGIPTYDKYLFATLALTAPSAVLWALVCWSAIGVAKARTWAQDAGWIASVSLFTLLLAGSVGLALIPPVVLPFSSAGPKLMGVAVVIRTLDLHTWVRNTNWIPLGLSLIDLVMLFLCFRLFASRDIKAWIASARREE